MILVLGGGFGLYGHLPALVAAGGPVAAPARYRPLAEARPELAGVVPQVEWVADEHAAAARADTIVLARRPADNVASAHRALAGETAARLVIEKPVAPDWRAADTLESALIAAGRRWAVPYLLLHCDWFPAVGPAIRAGRTVRIDWRHRQSPAVRSWKQADAQGGGAAAFYFIHALALVAALRPDAAPAFTHRRDATGERIGAQAGALAIDFRLAGELRFRVTVDGSAIVDEVSPFGPMPVAGAPDPRIPVLGRFYAAIDGADARGAEFHRTVTRHWRALAEAGA